ncbi:MAG TPA: glycoside hydrolase family 36 protein, partial [Rectinemataceae bacterium]|nr:glycoside hydrolase family 36 protein [Rectinemataceae bacterium]
MEFEKLYTKDSRGIPILVLKCARDFVCDRPMQILAELSLRELCEATGADFAYTLANSGISAEDFLRPSGRLVLANGWQSWSFAGELNRRERPRRAILKKALNLFADHPAESEIHAMARRGARKPDIVSHFFVVIRKGGARLALVSDNVDIPRDALGPGLGHGPSHSPSPSRGEDRCLPPVTFFVGKSSLRIAVFAEGGRFLAGETIARIAILAAPGYFALKDKLGILFDAAHRFEDLRFLSEREADGQTAPQAAPDASLTAAPAPSSSVRLQPIGGFETWYNHYLDIYETIISRDLEAIGSNANLANEMFLKRGKPLVFQMDDGWEKKVGDWRPDEKKFPGGLASLAAAIENRGLIPGIWIAPFLAMPDCPVAREHPGWILRGEAGAPVLAGWNPGWGGDFFCLDLSLPEVEAYIVALCDTIISGWGFRYLKLDFLYAGMLRGSRGGSRGAGAG